MRKVFLGYVDISKNLYYLSLGLKELGYDVWLFNYQNKSTKSILNKLFIRYLNKKSIPQSKIIDLLNKTKYFIIRLLIFLNILLFRKVIIISFSGTLFNYRELFWFRVFKKKIIYWFHGSDSRPPYINKVYKVKLNSKQEFDNLLLKTKQIYLNIKKIEKQVKYIVCPISHAHFFEKKVIDPIFIGKPFHFNEVLIKKDKKLFPEGIGLKILHAPSKKDVKGSNIIREIISNIQNSGFQINFYEITSAQHSTVLQLICESDLVIDQLYSDIPIPSITKEAGFLGTPVVLSGYFMEVYDKKIFEKYLPPVYYCKPEELETTLRHLLNNRKELVEMRQKIKNFFFERFNSVNVANNFISLFDDNFFNQISLNPLDFSYTSGCGYSKSEVKNLINQFVKFYEKDSLLIHHNKVLSKAFLKEITNNDQNPNLISPLPPR